MKKIVLVFGIIIALFISFYYVLKYEDTPSYNPKRNYVEGKESEILSKFLLAKDSTIIELGEGHFTLSQSLPLDGVKHVTVKGSGIGKTVLNFKGQTKGAEGIRVTNCRSITLEGFTVENSKGDNIKVMDTDGITFESIESSWTGTVSKANGAYAIYPVLCNKVVINNCRAIGSSDAGIYVGQSNDVVISNNEAFYNVAGIESENSTNVKIYNNKAYNNTGGILVFDLPGLTQYGSNIEVFNNQVYDNNTKNFAAKGAIVGQVPCGTGSLILATKGVFIHDNTFVNNKTTAIAVVSYLLVYELGKRDKKNNDAVENKDDIGSVRNMDDKFSEDKNYNPYPRGIRIGENTYSNKHIFPTINNDFGKILLFKRLFKKTDIIWDGIKDSRSEYAVCLDGENKNTSFFALDALNDFKNASDDVSQFICN